MMFGLKDKGSGRRRAISISNTRKITAKRKKRIEKGSRALFLGSNPHSNGEDFSWSEKERFEISKVTKIRREEKKEAIRILNKETFIL